MCTFRLPRPLRPASIAGPALAYWLVRNGVEVTVVERAPALREGGHGVDFRGAQMRQLQRMDLVDEVRPHETGLGEQLVEDARGERQVTLPSWFASGEVEIPRGDLSRILYERTREDAEYRFGDSITALGQTADGVEAEFGRGRARRFDLVVGADGMHSAVRALALRSGGRGSPRSAATATPGTPCPTCSISTIPA